MLEEIDKIDGQILFLQKKKEKTIAKVQSECKHPPEAVREGEWRKMDYVRSFPEFRVCTLCGYAEEGWGCGFWKLAHHGHEIPKLSREGAQKFVRRMWSQEEMNEIRFEATRERNQKALAEYHRATGR